MLCRRLLSWSVQCTAAVVGCHLHCEFYIYCSISFTFLLQDISAMAKFLIIRCK